MRKRDPRVPLGTYGEVTVRVGLMLFFASDIFCAIWVSCETRNLAKFARDLGAGPVFGDGWLGVAMGACSHSDSISEAPKEINFDITSFNTVGRYLRERKAQPNLRSFSRNVLRNLGGGAK